ncbi:MAG: hypothetical protein HC836_33110 [Richelia sp. RM2_1_2]|nr:hypothetical protein [Richelia sp. RM2_1_2]
MGNDPVTAYWRWLLTLPVIHQWPHEDFHKRDAARTQTKAVFPHVVTLERSEEELSYLEQWCWAEFGPKHSICGDQSCWYEPQDCNSTFTQLPDSNSMLNHFHMGEWTTVWALKTTYNDGFCDFCFKLPEQAVYFKFTFDFID